MKRPVALLLLVFSITLLSGCAKRVIIHPDRVYLIQPGKTTAQELNSEFGMPTDVRETKDYTVRIWKATERKKLRLWYKVRPHSVHIPANILSVYFNYKDIVFDYTFNMQGPYAPNPPQEHSDSEDQL
jgi:hypothetical protein